MLTHKKIPAPKIHDIAALLTIVQTTGIEIPSHIMESAKLTGFSVAARYPGMDEEVTEEEFVEALDIAERVVKWVSRILDA